jgi:hypothetical protein
MAGHLTGSNVLSKPAASRRLDRMPASQFGCDASADLHCLRGVEPVLADGRTDPPEMRLEVVQVFNRTGGYDFSGVLQFVSKDISQIEDVLDERSVVGCGSVDRGAHPPPAVALSYERQ